MTSICKLFNQPHTRLKSLLFVSCVQCVGVLRLLILCKSVVHGWVVVWGAASLLPLCAVLTGNDYGAPKDADTLLGLLDVSALGRGGGRGKGKAPTSRIEGLLLWLSSFSSPAEALEEVSRLMGEECRGGGGRGKKGQIGGLSSQLWAGMQEYHITPQSSLARWFSGDKVAPGGRTSGLAQLPECLSQAAAQGQLAPLVVDAMVMRRVLLLPQVENSKLASSHYIARFIRQAVYGILLQRGQDVQARDVRVQENISQGTRGGRGRGGRGYRGAQVGGGRGVNVGFNIEHAAVAGTVQAQGSGALVCVEEYDRLDVNLKKNQVEAHPPRTPLRLDTLSQAPVAVRLGVLFEVLGMKESTLTSVPLHLRLAVAVTGFWLREAIPTPSRSQLQALVLGMVYGELSWNNQPGVPQLNWAAERHVLAGLDRQRVRPGERRGLDVGVAHSFSQWQACLWSTLCLNQLLLLPLPEPQLSWLYSGTLVHGLIKYLKGGRAAESLLAGGSVSGQLYVSLLDAVWNCSSKTHQSSSAAGRRKRGGGRGRRGRGGGGRGARGGGRGTGEINNRFAFLMVNEEFDDW
ncbi:protein asteroid homolog 1 [Micropterus dolomieu]|uniref:protein asteroid homolog 1 n=1 Tax=Micropterus dolomieu TaxID=147949 RepID=UPI001E8EA496|nr:protein asteroid homolog 1 [Micropterus dolomieu]